MSEVYGEVMRLGKKRRKKISTTSNGASAPGSKRDRCKREPFRKETKLLNILESCVNFHEAEDATALT